jgi:hypothetical protein
MNILNPLVNNTAKWQPTTDTDIYNYGNWEGLGDGRFIYDKDPSKVLIQKYDPKSGNQLLYRGTEGAGASGKTVEKIIAERKAQEAEKAKQQGMTKYAWLGDVGGGLASPIEYTYASDPSQLIRRMSRGTGGSGRWVSVVEDSETAGRLTPEGENRLGAQELGNKDKYGVDGLGYYLKKGYKEPVKVQPQTPAPAPVLSPIDSVARNTGLGKASMIPSKAGKYSFARPMGAY